MKKILKLVGWLLLTGLVVIAGLLIYVKTALPDVGDAPDLKAELTPANIERGHYLAHSVCVCMDCHSTRDWSKFSGPLMDGTLGKGGERFDQNMGFPGVFFSKNITPAGLKDWTDGEIYRAITSGVNRNGDALFPVMPYHYYGNLTKEDVLAIVAYLRSIPAITNTVADADPDFPMNFIINTIPHKGAHLLKPDTGNVVKYGEYMTNAAGCMECHTKQEKGEKLPGMDFAGGFEFKMPNGDMIRSANITPDNETGIGKYSEDFFVQLFKAYADSTYKPYAVQPHQFQTVMPWTMYGTMNEKDLRAIYAYLRTVKPVKNPVKKFEAAK